MCLWDFGHEVWWWIRGEQRVKDYSHCPSVCAIIPGHNEGETIGSTLESLWGSYPRLEIIVVDDGSHDGMAQIAQRFVLQHPGVLVLRRADRGGKSSAINYGLHHTQAEVILTVDADSHLGPRAIWEVVQPMKDPRVGVVSAIVFA